MLFGQYKPQVIIKTNVLNILFIPSVHAELELTKSTSLQFNFHRSKFILISDNQLLNSSVEVKKYIFNNIQGMQGFYGGLGVHLNYNYLAYVSYDSVTNKNKIGAGSIGPIVRAGYQTKLGKSRFTLDIGVGAAYMAIPLRRKTNYGGFEYRAMLGLGYCLFKK